MILAQNFFAILILSVFALPLLCKHMKHCRETQTRELIDQEETEEQTWYKDELPQWMNKNISQDTV